MNDDGRPGADLRRLVHDLRAPLNAIRLSLDLLRRSLDRDDVGGEEFREEQTRQIERIGRQVVAMNELLARLIEPGVREEAST
jgi:signal transduction histidine kinase